MRRSEVSGAQCADPSVPQDAAIVETRDIVLEAIDLKEKGAGEKPPLANPLISYGAEAGI